MPLLMWRTVKNKIKVCRSHRYIRCDLHSLCLAHVSVHVGCREGEAASPALPFQPQCIATGCASMAAAMGPPHPWGINCSLLIFLLTMSSQKSYQPLSLGQQHVHLQSNQRLALSDTVEASSSFSQKVPLWPSPATKNWSHGKSTKFLKELLPPKLIRRVQAMLPSAFWSLCCHRWAPEGTRQQRRAGTSMKRQCWWVYLERYKTKSPGWGYLVLISVPQCRSETRVSRQWTWLS